MKDDDEEMRSVNSLPNHSLTPLNISENINETNTSNVRKKNLVQRLFFFAILISFITYAIVDSFTNQYIKDSAIVFLEWVEEHLVAGVFASIGVYMVATVFFIPGSILTLGIGFVFANAFGLGLGVILATISVFIGATLGATLSFLFGRYLLRDWVKQWTEKHSVFKAIDTALAKKGFHIMSLLRLSPIIPFNAINYMAGITAMTLKDYILAMIAMLPGVILFVFIGASAGSLVESRNSGNNNTIRIITIVLGIFFGILGIALTSYYAKKELNQIIETQESNDTQQDQDINISVKNHIS